MLFFQLSRFALIIWSAVMISAIDSVSIRTEGKVELETTSRDTYTEVLSLAVSTFLGDFSYKVIKDRQKIKGVKPPKPTTTDASS